MNYTAKWYMLRWLCGLADIVDGVAITLSAGFYFPGIGLRATDLFLTETERLKTKENIKFEKTNRKD